MDDRPVRRLILASTTSNLGDGVMLAAFPLLVHAATDDATAVAAMTAAATLPWLLFGLFAGVVADRVERRRLMQVVDLVRAVVIGLLAVALLVDSTPLVVLYGAVFALGLAETLFDSAAMSYLPAVVPAERLEWANGRLFAGQMVANQFAGPALGAWLFVAHAAWPPAVDALTFAVAAALLAGLPRSSLRKRTARTSVRADVVEGLRWLWRRRDIRAFAIGAAVINLAQTGAMSVLVVMARDRLGLSSGAFGFLFAAAAVGALAGTLVAERAVARLGRRRIVLAAVWLIAGGLLVAGLAPTVPTLACGLVVTELAAQLWNVVAVSHRQATTPEHLLGRVMSAYRVIAYGSFPVGALLGGLVAEHVSVAATFVIGGLGVVLLGLLLPRALPELGVGARPDLASSRRR